MAAQLSFTNARPHRELSCWIAGAISSVPVPPSAWIRTVASVGATRSTWSSTTAGTAICSNLGSAERRSQFSALLQRTRTATQAIRSQVITRAPPVPSRAAPRRQKGFARNSTAPARNACTRIRSSPCAVTPVQAVLAARIRPSFGARLSRAPDPPARRLHATREWLSASTRWTPNGSWTSRGHRAGERATRFRGPRGH